MDKVYVYDINISDRLYHVRFILRKVKYLRMQIRNGKDIYFIGRRVLTYKEMEKLVRENEKKIIKYLNQKRIDFDKDNQFMIFGLIYNKSDFKIEDIRKYQIEAINEIEKMFYEIGGKYNFDKCELYIRKMKSRWGVCYPNKKKIGLSTYLLCIPKNLINYVICHEYCHLLYANHSRDFYNELKKYVPDCIALRKELKQYISIL